MYGRKRNRLFSSQRSDTPARKFRKTRTTWLEEGTGGKNTSGQNEVALVIKRLRIPVKCWRLSPRHMAKYPFKNCVCILINGNIYILNTKRPFINGNSARLHLSSCRRPKVLRCVGTFRQVRNNSDNTVPSRIDEIMSELSSKGWFVIIVAYLWSEINGCERKMHFMIRSEISVSVMVLTLCSTVPYEENIGKRMWITWHYKIL